MLYTWREKKVEKPIEKKEGSISENGVPDANDQKAYFYLMIQQ